MFRTLRRKDRGITDETAKKLLENERRGVLAVNGDDGYPYAFPINYLYDADAGKIYFHGSKSGHKVDALRRSDKVCFTVYGNERIDEDASWAPYVQSAVVFGRCSLIDNLDQASEGVRRVARKYYPDAETAERVIAQSAKNMYLYVIDIEHLAGKQIQER